MHQRTFSSVVDQVRDQLRQGMVGGRWREVLPGRDRLARELGCSHSTVEEAMQRLSREGLLVSQGAGKRRRIVLNAQVKRTSGFRVRVLAYEKSDREGNYLLNHLISRLREIGHDAAFASMTMHDFGMNAKRIGRYVEATDTDAWVVVAGSQDVLEWFSQRSQPAFALFGRSVGLPLASSRPSKDGPMRELVGRLYDFGHRRIVMLAREERRKPGPGEFERRFLEALEEKGIQTSAYNLPDWNESPEGLGRVVESLFKYTAPTALLIDEFAMLIAVMQRLGRMGILVPEQVSLACTDTSPAFEWCRPDITHIAWGPHPLIQRMVKWVDKVSLGKEDRRKTFTKAQLVIGGTIGPAPK